MFTVDENEEDNKDLFYAPARSKSFTGRIDILEKLWESLHSKEGIAEESRKRGDVGRGLSAISGLGGTGKTSVAVEYVWIHKEYYSGGCYWLSVDDLEGSISDLACYIGAHKSVTFDGSSTVRYQLSGIMSYLLALKRPWLLILDNMDLTELSSHPLLETIVLGPWRQSNDYGNLMVTSRCNADVLSEIFHIDKQTSIHVLHEFMESESIAFLEQRTSSVKNEIEFSKDRAAILARQVGHLPLALEQVAAYLIVTRCSLDDYVSTYKKQRSKLLKRRKIAKPSGQDKASNHRLAVHTTWTINFDRIERHEEFGQCADSFVRMCAFLAPEKIPYILIKATDEQLFQTDSTALRSIVGLLTELSLFREEYEKKGLSVHRLVQEVLQECIKVSGCEELHATFESAVNAVSLCLQRCKKPNLMEYCLRERVGEDEQWGILSSHVFVLQEHIFSNAPLLGPLFRRLVCYNVAVLLDNASIYCNCIGRLSVAKLLDRQKLRVLDTMDDRLSKDDVIRLTSTIIPLPLKVQQNVRRAIRDETMSGIKLQTVGDISSKRKDGDVTTVKSSREVRKDLIKILRTCDRHVAEEVANELSSELSRLSSTCRKNTMEERYSLVSCRARAYLQSGKLDGCYQDATECIKLLPARCDGYEILSQLFALIQYSSLPLARCVAAVAMHLNAESCRMKWFKQAYPNVPFVKITTQENLRSILANQKRYRGFTVLVDNKQITDNVIVVTENINFVGLHQCRMDIDKGIFIQSYSCWVNFQMFMRNGGFIASCEAHACLLHCRLTSTLAGVSIISVSGSVYLDRCQIIDSDAGGLTVCTTGIRGPATAAVCFCLVKGNKAAGLEARYGGCLMSIGNTVCENGVGYLLGPLPGDCLLQSNIVFMNGQGIEISHRNPVNPLFSEDKVLDYIESMPCQPESVPSVVIERNELCENLTYGIHLLYVTSRCGVVSVRKNLINGNMYWGFGSLGCCDPHPNVGAVVTENTIRSNKCGGMRVRYCGVSSHRITDNVIENNLMAFSKFDLSESVLETYKSDNIVKNNKKTLHYPHSESQWQKNSCSHCHTTLRQGKQSIQCQRCYASNYCGSPCLEEHKERHTLLCEIIRRRYSVNTSPSTLAPSETVGVTTKMNPKHKRGPSFAPVPQIGGPRFAVKLQTQEESETSSSLITIYDQTHTIYTVIVNTQLYDLIMNCGVVGEMCGTSKKVFCWAVFEGKDNIRIFFHELAPYTDEW